MIAVLLAARSCTKDSEKLLLPQNSCSVLSLLNVEPLHYPAEVDRFDGLWNRGLDVIPAGHIATEQINNRSDILPGYELELIDVESEACGVNVIVEGVANVVKELVKSRKSKTCIVGVVGLLCSAVTKAIYPIVNHPKLGGYVQLSSSTSPIYRITDSDHIRPNTNLFRVISTSSVFNDATTSLMKAYGWARISIVHDSVGLFPESVANNFVEKVNRSAPNLELVSRISISRSSPEFSKTFDALRDEDARVSYWSVSYTQSAHLLCEAYRRNFQWPGYIFIIREPTLSNILGTQTTTCSRDELLEGLEGSFLLHYRLFVDDDTLLFSGVSYGEYKELYAKRLQELSNRTNQNRSETVYANSLYDQVWAFALALNNSLPSINSENISFGDYGIGRGAPFITDTIKNELRSVSFQGASGRISFGEGQESPTFVDIFQVQNGTPQLVGVYNPFANDITFTNNDPRNSSRDFPSDRFKTFYEQIPVWLIGCIVFAQGVLFSLTTVNLILILRWRKKREIKATSPVLSILMVIGCYLLCVGPILLAIIYSITTYYSTEIESHKTDTGLIVRVLCVLKSLVLVGFEFILATLFLRLFRIYTIFQRKHLRMMSDYWMDKYLVIYTLVVCAGKLILIILWNCIDPIVLVTRRKYIKDLDSFQLPYYVATTYCTSESSRVWLVFTLMYTGVLQLLVLIFAVLTRRIKNDNYKDTKKVNVFIFFVTITFAVTLPLLLISMELDLQTGVIIAEWLAYLFVPTLCQVCLFLPKTLPLLVAKKIKTKSKI